MDGEEKSQTNVGSSQMDTEIVTRGGSPLPQADPGIGSNLSPASIDGPQQSMMSSNLTPVSTDDNLMSESDAHESNDETFNKCPIVSGTGALATDAVDVSKDHAVKEKCDEPLPESSSDSCVIPKPDSETDMAVQSHHLPENLAPESVPSLGSPKRSQEKGEKSPKLLVAQVTEGSTKEDTEPKSTSDAPTLGLQMSSCSVVVESNPSFEISSNDSKSVGNDKEATLPTHERELESLDRADTESERTKETQLSCSVTLESNQSSEVSSNQSKSQENDSLATSASQERELESHDKAEIEPCKESKSKSAEMSTNQSENTDSCPKERDSKSQSEFSETAIVDESSNMSSETVPSMAHADLDQVNIEESMETSSPTEDSDPIFLKDTEKHDNASKELYAEDTANKSSVDDSGSTSQMEGNNSESSEMELPKTLEGKGEQKIAARDTSDAQDADTSSTTGEGNNPIVLAELDNDTANVICGDTEDNENNSNLKQTHSEDVLVTASPEPDQTIIGDKMGEEVCIVVPDTTPKEGSENAQTSQTSDVSASEEVPSTLAVHQVHQQAIPESKSGNTTSAQKDPSESPSSSATEKGSLEQSRPGDLKSDVSTNEEMSAPSKNLDMNKHKVGIHLVSTSSLVSRQNTSDMDTDSDGLDSCKINDVNDRKEDSPDENCAECGKMVQCKYKLLRAMGYIYLCEDSCYNKFRKANDSPQPRTIRARKMDQPYEHKCGQCSKIVDMKLEKTLTWETMDFCNSECLEKCQRTHGSYCANCKAYVLPASLGKYCVRFGYDMKQFCSAPCLEDFKKGLKVCSYCQKDISRGEGFLAPVGDKGAFKDFCAQECMEKYEQMSSNTVPPEVTQECAVCNEVKPVKVQVILDSNLLKLCSEPCFAAFKFVNKIVADKCDMCKKYYDRDRPQNFSVYYDEAPHSFCCKTCMNVYILAKRKIVPCSWCKVKKYNFDMIKKVSNGQNVTMMCSLHCLELHQASPTVTATSKPGPRKILVKKAGLIAPPTNEKEKSTSKSNSMPVISSVTSLAPSTSQLSPATPDPPTKLVPAVPVPSSNKSTSSETVKTVYKQQFILRPPPHPEMSNCAVQVKPITVSKSVSCQPELCEVSTQTDDSMFQPVLVPVPVPIYIPMPMHMYTIPYPVPVPIALPIPVPFFIPTTKNSAKGILQEIKRIQENVPSDPFEAELLMMAEMVAGEKKGENTETDSEDGGNDADDGNSNDSESATKPELSPVHQDTIGDDVLQMALKMASDFDEPAANFAGTVGPTSVSQSRPSRALDKKDESEGEDIEAVRSTRSGKKIIKRSGSRSSSVSSKRTRTSSSSDQQNVQPVNELTAYVKEHSVEKPDANMSLKFSLGVNAWKHWVTKKNAELEKLQTNKVKLFKTELLQLTADELNYSLCLFVCEAQDPNGHSYTPDIMYYLCLGIQQYLMENGRVDNIFCDPYYEKFTDCLDDAVKRFSPLKTNSQQLVTRIQEEHLWESKQLGANSPFILLNTLMYFNTKHFDVTTVEEHMQLSFTHIMKNWKRNSSSPNSKALGAKSNSVLLRFYPPPSALAGDSKKKKVYEQQENETNPLRCPVKLYEFYLSKCPESVKTRNDVFYLLPERSCVPDSPVWYSTMSLDRAHVQKMLHRIKVVREIVDI